MPERVVLGLGMTTTATLSDCSEALSRILSPDWVVLAVSTLGTKQAVARGVADQLGVPLLVWSAEELRRVTVPTPSTRVAAETGTPSVAEAAAILAAGGGRLVRNKAAWHGVTVAVACVQDWNTF